ncbi:hypothetical protein P4U14_34450, partial [Bacillus paranthracis]|nr:hypothetical protein [Bacillus paranthracis]
LNSSTPKKKDLLSDNALVKDLGVDVSSTQQFIMNFYESQMSAGHLISDIDKQDLLAYMDMVVYKTVRDYVKTLAQIDSSGGGVAGAL